MSAAIFYQPVNPGKRISVGAPSGFLDSIEKALHQSPHHLRLNKNDVPVLTGMKAATNDKDYEEAYEELIQAIDNSGEIEISILF